MTIEERINELGEKYEKQKEINKELVDENEALKFAARMSEKTELQLREQIEKLKADLNEAIEDANRWEETETFSVLNRIYNDNFEVITSVSN